MKNPPNVQLATSVDRKAINRARYERRYARQQAAAPTPRWKPHQPTRPSLTPLERAQMLMRGVPEYLQQVVRMRFGPKGSWGHGLQAHGTKAGPGRRPLPRLYRTREGSPLLSRDHPAGTKVIRQFIRQSGKESTFWRNAYAALTGRQYG
jgi:hypothetical protein